jgi:hypothetical protein
MDNMATYIVWMSSLLLGFLTFGAIYFKVKKWYVFFIIAILISISSSIFDFPLLAVPPFSTTYSVAMAEFSLAMQAMLWYFKGMLFSTFPYILLCTMKSKSNNARIKDVEKEGVS